MWLACHKPLSGQRTNIRTIKLKDTVTVCAHLAFIRKQCSSYVKGWTCDEPIIPSLEHPHIENKDVLKDPCMCIKEANAVML
jgi:hypothetical protein